MKYASAVEANAAYKKAGERLSKMHPGAFTIGELQFILQRLAAQEGGHVFVFEGKTPDALHTANRIIGRLVELSEKTIGI